MTGAIDPETRRRLDLLFAEADRAEAIRLLSDWEIEGDRVRIAALKLSGGHLEKLRQAIALGSDDWRDLLQAAGFASDVRRHLRWLPKA